MKGAYKSSEKTREGSFLAGSSVELARQTILGGSLYKQRHRGIEYGLSRKWVTGCAEAKNPRNGEWKQRRQEWTEELIKALLCQICYSSPCFSKVSSMGQLHQLFGSGWCFLQCTFQELTLDKLRTSGGNLHFNQSRSPLPLF